MLIDDLLTKEIKQLKIAVDCLEGDEYESDLRKEWLQELSKAIVLRISLENTGLNTSDIVFLYKIVQHWKEE